MISIFQKAAGIPTLQTKSQISTQPSEFENFKSDFQLLQPKYLALKSKVEKLQPEYENLRAKIIEMSEKFGVNFEDNKLDSNDRDVSLS